MTTLYVLSDLHLESAPFEPDPQAMERCDAVILAGDILPGLQGLDWADRSFSRYGKPVIYVAGNHEFWECDFDTHVHAMRKRSRELGSVIFLEDESAMVGDLRILGCTLWTDFEAAGPHRLEYSMNMARNQGDAGYADYFEITRDGRILQPEDERARHLQSRAWLKTELSKGDPSRTVVVTHHLPHWGSTDPRYVFHPHNACYTNSLPVGFCARGSLWIHGHTHTSTEYQIQSGELNCRVIANPRGLVLGGDQRTFENKHFRPGFLVEVPQADATERIHQ